MNLQDSPPVTFHSPRGQRLTFKVLGDLIDDSVDEIFTHDDGDLLSAVHWHVTLDGRAVGSCPQDVDQLAVVAAWAKAVHATPRMRQYGSVQKATLTATVHDVHLTITGWGRAA